jgi:hypothetical protein
MPAQGVGKLLGYFVMTAPDGDKVLAEITEDKKFPPPNPNRNTGKFIGGTGKFSRIEGTIESTRYYSNAIHRLLLFSFLWTQAPAGIPIAIYDLKS